MHPPQLTDVSLTAVSLTAVSLDAVDPGRVARFWGDLLGWTIADDAAPGTVELEPDDDTGFRLRFVPTLEPKAGPHRYHPDLTSTAERPQARTVERALALGARPLDVGQRPEEGHVVLADPEDNEFCVLAEGNRFLAGCGFLGGLSGDGTQAVGLFWSRVLDWPLTWDQDEETAIRSPAGGAMLSWGGPPVAPLVGRSRVRWHLTIGPEVRLAHEVEALVDLGAGVVSSGPPAVLTDPDGTEFTLDVGTV